MTDPTPDKREWHDQTAHLVDQADYPDGPPATIPLVDGQFISNDGRDLVTKLDTIDGYRRARAGDREFASMEPGRRFVRQFVTRDGFAAHVLLFEGGSQIGISPFKPNFEN
jgi:hypothetical protein